MNDDRKTGRVGTTIPQGLSALPGEITATIETEAGGILIEGSAGREEEETARRIKGAVEAAGFRMPAERIRIGRSAGPPTAEQDLAGALAILVATGQVDQRAVANTAAVGSLDSDGRLEIARGMIGTAAAVRGAGLRLACPASQRAEAGAAGMLQAVTAGTLAELVEKLKTPGAEETLETGTEPGRREGVPSIDELQAPPAAKEAATIAAAGRHHILLSGKNQGGQAWLARCLAGLMSDPAEREQSAVWTIHSAAGGLDPAGNGWPRRPTQRPHSSTSRATLTGQADAGSGGSGIARCGTLTLAHEGVLIIDDLEKWDEAALEAVREAAERGYTPAADGRLPARVLVAAITRGNHQSPLEAWSKLRSKPERISRIFQLGARVERGLSDQARGDHQERDVRERTLRRQVALAKRAQEKRYGQGGRNGTAGTSILYFRAKVTKAAAEQLVEHRRAEGVDSSFRVLRVARTLADMRERLTVTPALIDEAAARANGTAEPIE